MRSGSRWIDGKWTEIAPTHCPNGHRLKPGTLLVSYLPCPCLGISGGHRTWRCRTCDAVTYDPPHHDVVGRR